MFDIPQRVTLCAQVVAAIRKGIKERTWVEYLPGERRLAATFQVSRPTVRSALQTLAEEGVIVIRPGYRNRILVHPPRRRSVEKGLVAIVTHESPWQLPIASHQALGELRTNLAEHGFASDIFVLRDRAASTQRRKLEALLRENRVLCCVLLSVSQELQHWFAAHSIPALVLGSCHPSVRLPSFDVDYRSVCRHAAGLLLARGHRHLALVLPDSGHAGELASEQGFTEAIAGHRQAGRAQAAVIRHNGQAQNLGAKLDALFRSPRPPTALLVAKPQFVLFALLHLLQRGWAVPEQVSLIARDQDSLFGQMNPPVAHYHFPGDAYHRRLNRLVLQMVRQGRLPPKPILIFPRLFVGQTVKSVSAGAS